VSESDLIIQFFVRAVSGVVALVVGTGLCYVLFIGGYLRGTENYKQRLKVYKRLYKRIEKILKYIDLLKKNARWADYFAKECDAFNSYVKSEDKLFMSPSVKTLCQDIIKAIEALPPHNYPESPGKVVDYPQPKLLNMGNRVESLRQLIEDEIEVTGFGIPPELAEFWSRMKGRWHRRGGL
jgi:hypothetical protein